MDLSFKILFLVLVFHYSMAQESVTERFNQNSSDFCDIQIGTRLNVNIIADSIFNRMVFYHFDSAFHKETETRFTCGYLNYEANYFIFELDEIVHLI